MTIEERPLLWQGYDENGLKCCICEERRRNLDKVLSELLVSKGYMNYLVQFLGYDPESDELDVLINSVEPQPAYTVDLGGVS